MADLDDHTRGMLIEWSSRLVSVQSMGDGEVA